MPVTSEQVVQSVATAAGHELGDAFAKIGHCVKQLDDDQLWWRPPGDLNSIANLMLHLAGNLRQWIVAGIGGEPDRRDRPKEFSNQERVPAAALLEQLAQAVSSAREAMAVATAAELLRIRRIQGFDVTGTQAIFDSVAHFRGHTQEIVHMTRSLLRDSYDFDFVPSTPEQGAPGS